MGKDDDNDGGGGCASHMLKGVVEMDECYIGGKAENKHMSKRIALLSKNDKAVLFGMLERGGKVRAFQVKNASYPVLGQKVIDNIDKEATLITDSFCSYTTLGMFYKHKTINHSGGKYIVGDIYTNGIEGFWATLKRGVIGVYHHISKKRLQNYVSEFCFRYNHRNVANAFDVLLSRTVLVNMG